MRADRLYVIIGDSLRPFSEPPYKTDPRAYGLWPFEKPVSEEEFERDYRMKVKSFTDRNHAVGFAMHCNLASLSCPVFDRLGEGWVYNEAETDRLADEID